jgi:Flp pilus assembly protein TadG
VKSNQATSSQSPQRQFRRNRTVRSGSSIIEMFFAFQLLLFLTFGMVEFGQFMFVRHAFASAARDGCRVAILPSTATLTPVTTAISNTLANAGIITGTVPSSWVTLQQSSDGTTFTAVSGNNPSNVPTGWAILVKVETTYSQLSCAIRPLSAITANKWGVGPAKLVTGTSTMVMQ